MDKTDDRIRNETRRVKLVETKSASCGEPSLFSFTMEHLSLLSGTKAGLISDLCPWKQITMHLFIYMNDYQAWFFFFPFCSSESTCRTDYSFYRGNNSGWCETKSWTKRIALPLDNMLFHIQLIMLGRATKLSLPFRNWAMLLPLLVSRKNGA